MDIGRILKHLCTTALHLRARFPRQTLDAIEQEIAKSESLHSGELRFAVERALDLQPLLQGLQSRQRALDIFSMLRVWDTEMNSGVLIYLLLVDHKVEIIADRGIAAKVEHSEWETICREMEKAFRSSDFKAGSLLGVQRISALLARHSPAGTHNPNELPNKPFIF